jgi:hypothetical protein
MPAKRQATRISTGSSIQFPAPAHFFETSPITFRELNHVLPHR